MGRRGAATLEGQDADHADAHQPGRFERSRVGPGALTEVDAGQPRHPPPHTRAEDGTDRGPSAIAHPVDERCARRAGPHVPRGVETGLAPAVRAGHRVQDPSAVVVGRREVTEREQVLDAQRGAGASEAGSDSRGGASGGGRQRGCVLAVDRVGDEQIAGHWREALERDRHRLLLFAVDDLGVRRVDGRSHEQAHGAPPSRCFPSDVEPNQVGRGRRGVGGRVVDAPIP
ncbi:MAG: hypothetical protein ACYDH6_22110 [Acidimicrobiales bacterium]